MLYLHYVAVNNACSAISISFEISRGATIHLKKPYEKLECLTLISQTFIV